MLSKNCMLPLAARSIRAIASPSVSKVYAPTLSLKSGHTFHARSLTTKTLNSALELCSNYGSKILTTQENPLRIQFNEERPLAVILAWLMAQKKHTDKYAKFYLDQGFDVLTVKCTPLQLLFPVNGSQLVAKDLLSFLHQNENYKKTVLHGFSVGGYLWGEVLTLLSKDISKYKTTINRIAGQIWDSPVDYNETPIGVPKAMFPTNALLRKSLEEYILFHMKAFQNLATKHHLEATSQFFNSLVKAPAMFLFSLNDPMVNVASVKRCGNIWSGKGMPVYFRAWESPPHVGILQRHPEEYQDEINKFLERHVFPLNINPVKVLATSRA